MNRLVITYFVLIVTLISCNKDDSVPVQPKKAAIPHNTMDTSLYIYKYKVGTFWVYHDNITGFDDSIIVTSNISGEMNLSSPPSGPGMGGSTYAYSEFFQINTRSSKNISNPSYILMGNSFCERVYNVYHPAFAYWPVYEPMPDHSGRTTLFQDSTIQLGTLTFYHCLKIKFEPNQDSPFQAVTYYTFSRDYGIIRKEIFSTGSVYSRDWQLITSNIVR
jgi:hypothetical protein